MKNKNILLRAERDGQFRALMDWGPKLKPDFYKLQVTSSTCGPQYSRGLRPVKGPLVTRDRIYDVFVQ